MRSVAFSSLRGLSRAASRFQPATLPRVAAAARAYSTPAENQYEFIQVSEPRPGVGQGEHLHPDPASKLLGFNHLEPSFSFTLFNCHHNTYLRQP